MRRRAFLIAGGIAAALACAAQSPASPAAPPGAAVQFPATDGHRLRGREYGIGPRWVILVHDEGGDSRAWGGLVGKLSARGYRVLAFDLRGHGLSLGPANGLRAPEDVAGALRFARSRGADGLYVVSAGSGASAALVAASSYRVRALVALSPRPSRSRLPRAIPIETRAPKLIIVGALDERAGKDADAVFRRSIGWVLLKSPPVSVQGTALLRSSWADHVHEQIFAFLDDYPFDPPA